MKTTGRAAVVGLAFASLVALAGCTGGSDGSASGSGGKSPGDGGGEPSVTVSIPARSSVYRYDNAGLVATVDFAKDTLTIDNGTGKGVLAPGFYVLDARDGHRIDGVVEQTSAVSEGQTVTFMIAPLGIDLRNVGLVVLMIGPDNYGAFVQQ